MRSYWAVLLVVLIQGSSALAGNPEPQPTTLPGTGISLDEALADKPVFVVLAKALDNGDDAMTASGLLRTEQEFGVSQVFADKFAVEKVKIAYFYGHDRVAGIRTRKAFQGESLIWIIRPRTGGDTRWDGVKALADTADNRRRVQQATSQPADSPPATRQSYSFPYLTPEQRAQKAKEAVDPSTDAKTRFDAVWGLAISGYSRESAEALASVAADSKYDATTRGYAGMGLSNFSNAISEEVRQAALDRLYGALNAEREKLPDGVMRTLINWGDADRVRQTLGDKLSGHRMEIEVLQRIGSREEAVAGLMALYRVAPDVTSSIGWTRRWHVGAALIERQDKRGIDILIECLTVQEPWPIDNPSPQATASNAASFRQSLHNTFTRLATIFDDRFGYEAGGTWNAQLADAIPKMVAWWKISRQTWSFDEARSTELPTLEQGKALTKRQARVLAAKLANDAFAEKTFKHANGNLVGKIEITRNRSMT